MKVNLADDVWQSYALYNEPKNLYVRRMKVIDLANIKKCRSLIIHSIFMQKLECLIAI
jgi:hypothetical protein